MTTLTPDAGVTAQAATPRTVPAVTASDATGDYAALPQRLSFSRSKDYMQCPRKFYFKTILGIREPGSIASVRGNLAHAAFERVFDHPPGERTPEVAIAYIAPAWQAMTTPELDGLDPDGPEAEQAIERAQEVRDLAPPGSPAEQELLTTTEDVVRSWFVMENADAADPQHVLLPDGRVVDGREIHVAAQILGVPLHGFIDRLDRWVTATGEARYSVTDYKTGKVPAEGKNYRPETMARIVDEAFLQLRLYAVLCQAVLGIRVDLLRLVYVKTGDRVNGIKKHWMTDQDYTRTAGQMQALWANIEKSARTSDWPTKTGPLCQWCHFKDVCPATGGAELGQLLPEEIAARLERRPAA